MVDLFAQRVSTRAGLDRELHAIEVKVSVGLLERAEDSYMWPYIEAAMDKLEGESGPVLDPS